jgi:serine/threonine protein kinase
MSTAEEDEAPKPAPKKGQGYATTAIGPADIRDTPSVKPAFPTIEDEEPEEPDPWIGRKLSNVYVVESRIGEGGMGAVYLAKHVHLQKSFAIKVLSDAIAEKKHAVERLKQEAMAAANIDHENIVQVVNFDRTDDGSVFIVMELLKGESLADTIGRGPIELHRALPIAFQICGALQAAHAHGIVHRDLKPENVFLSDKAGRTIVKVLDFGISKIKSADAEQVRMTRTGQLVGTPLYMSPEQARGETDIDKRVDVYALGVILYEMITGAPPFEGRNYFELLWKHGNEPHPSLKERNPNVYAPDALEAVVAKALAKNKDDRYGSMAELEQALLEAVPEVPPLASLPSLPPERPSAPRIAKPVSKKPTETIDEIPKTPKPQPETAEVELPTHRTPWVPIAIGAAALLLIGAGGYALWPSDDLPPREPRPIALPEPPPEPEPEVIREPAPPPPEAPRTSSLSLTSMPAGAEVRLGDRVLGVTPLVAPLPVSQEAVSLTFVLDGYFERSVSVIPSEDLTVPAVRLRRRREGAAREDGVVLPMKTGL